LISERRPLRINLLARFFLKGQPWPLTQGRAEIIERKTRDLPWVQATIVVSDKVKLKQPILSILRIRPN
jgi:hypothetical protein